MGSTYLDDWPWLPDSDPSPPPVTDNKVITHGTMMLGLVAATIDNTVGLAGTEDYARIMPIKICDIFGRFDHRSYTKALRYASTRPWPVDVYCLGLHLGKYTPDVELELKMLYERGHPIFAAAGNEGSIKYPASSPYVCAVGATDRNDAVPAWSGMGSGLDICAPGDTVWSFDFSGVAGYNDGSICNGDEDYYCEFWGTSCATAIASGIATKMLATRGDIITPSDSANKLYDLLKYTANDLYSAGPDNVSGWGRINAYRAMIAITRGDVNQDYAVNMSDAVIITNFVYIGGPPPVPYFYLGDANCDGAVNVSDAIWIINYVNIGGPPPLICYSNLPE